ncbi:hypothetical protein DH2020_047495 [Rehmannia glutinosa]|uniref:KIB1-4 beta-propeller domain-containing protein n=1 Tax=Rehmannia glutinosa TaxID=99300 RepID=A0ABR0U8X0_REHGL
MEIIELPRLDESYLYNKCVLSKPPTEPDCHILFNSASTMEQSFCKIGDLEFVHHSLEEEEYELMAIASFQGKIYGVIDPGYRFVTIKLVGKTLELSPMLMNDGEPWRVPERLPKSVEWHENDLVESPCGGELMLVIKTFSKSYIKDGAEFRIFRVDINGMECVELDNIGEQTIFIGYNGRGFCSSSLRKGIKPNSIYYTDEEGRDLYIYDLRFGAKDSLLPCPIAGRYRSANYWVELRDDVLYQLIDK